MTNFPLSFKYRWHGSGACIISFVYSTWLGPAGVCAILHLIIATYEQALISKFLAHESQINQQATFSMNLLTSKHEDAGGQRSGLRGVIESYIPVTLWSGERTSSTTNKKHLHFPSSTRGGLSKTSLGATGLSPGNHTCLRSQLLKSLAREIGSFWVPRAKIREPFLPIHVTLLADGMWRPLFQWRGWVDKRMDGYKPTVWMLHSTLTLQDGSLSAEGALVPGELGTVRPGLVPGLPPWPSGCGPQCSLWLDASGGDIHTAMWAGRLPVRPKTERLLIFQVELQSSWCGPSRDQPISRELCDLHPLLAEKREPNQQMLTKLSSSCEMLNWNGCLLNKNQWTINKTLVSWIQQCIERLRWDEWNVSQLC